MIRAFGLGSNATNYKDALKEVREWLDKEEGKTTPIITVDGNKTTVKLPDGRVGVARCNPCDKFNIIEGIRVALDDIERKSVVKLSEEEIMCLKVAQKAGANYVKVDKWNMSKNDIYMSVHAHLDDDDYADNVVLYFEDDKIFTSLENGKFYLIRTLLQERS